MNNRLQQFLSAENISQAQFADTIDVARASVSHVLAGRNKPGYDFIKSISDHYPKLSMEWLINGKGKMYKDNSTVPPVSAAPAPEKNYDDDLFSSLEEEKSPATDEIQPKIMSLTETKDLNKTTQVVNNKRSILKIVVFYDDNTYQELV